MKVHVPRIGDKTRELTGNKAELKSSHIGKPKESTDKRHVSLAVSGHIIIFGRAKLRALFRRESTGGINRGVKTARDG